MPRGALPPPIRGGFGDHVTGMTLAGGICGALFDRERTGRGHLVSTSLLRAGLYCAGWDLGVLLRFGKLESTRARHESRTPLVNCYAAADGAAFWLLGLESERHWPPLVAALDRPDLAADDRFATAPARLEHCAALVAELDVAFASRPMAVWAERFDTHDVWWAPINNPRTVLHDPQVEASGAFVEMSGDDGETWRAIASPIDFDDLANNRAASHARPAQRRRPGPVEYVVPLEYVVTARAAARTRTAARTRLDQAVSTA